MELPIYLTNGRDNFGWYQLSKSQTDLNGQIYTIIIIMFCLFLCPSYVTLSVCYNSLPFLSVIAEENRVVLGLVPGKVTTKRGA